MNGPVLVVFDAILQLSKQSPACSPPTQTSLTLSLYSSQFSKMSDIETKSEADGIEQWSSQMEELLIMGSLSFVSLMVALDATILVTVLPVCRSLHFHREIEDLGDDTVRRTRFGRYISRSLLACGCIHICSIRSTTAPHYCSLLLHRW